MSELALPKQRINLYQPIEQKRVPFGFNTLAAMLLVGVVGLVGAYAYMAWEIQHVNQQASALETELLSRQQQLAKLQTALPSTEPDPYLRAEVDKLHTAHGRIREVIHQLAKRQVLTEQGFSDVLRGLASHPVDGLWLEQLRVINAGEQLYLKGRVTEAARVPQLLQKLRSEPVFAGRAFHAVQIRRSGNTDDAMIFELSSGHPAEVENEH